MDMEDWKGVEAAAEDLALINRLSKTELGAEQVYVFTVRLCDNEVDRDFERFDSEALERLGELLVGRSGLFDHQWSARGQAARLYKTEVVREPAARTEAGDEYGGTESGGETGDASVPGAWEAVRKASRDRASGSGEAARPWSVWERIQDTESGGAPAEWGRSGEDAGEMAADRGRAAGPEA